MNRELNINPWTAEVCNQVCHVAGFAPFISWIFMVFQELLQYSTLKGLKGLMTELLFLCLTGCFWHVTLLQHIATMSTSHKTTHLRGPGFELLPILTLTSSAIQAPDAKVFLVEPLTNVPSIEEILK